MRSPKPKKLLAGPEHPKKRRKINISINNKKC